MQFAEYLVIIAALRPDAALLKEETLMHKLPLYGCVLCAVFTFALQVQGQSPAPAPAAVPEMQPFDIQYGAPISFERAKQAIEAAVAEAKKRNWKCAIAVVDQAGDLVYLVKMDGTQYAGSKIAEHKARAAAIFRRPTKTFFDAIESGHPYIMTLDGMIGADGGLPIIEGGKIIGGIGVSGGTGAQDAIVAKAGSDTVK
jgi:glc operon protein GlcG